MTDIEKLIKELKARKSQLVSESISPIFFNDRLFLSGRINELEYVIQELSELIQRDLHV